MALTTDRTLNLAKASLTLITPRCDVKQDPHGVFQSADAVRVLTEEITAAEQSSVDPDARPLLALFAERGSTYGPHETALSDLKARAIAVLA